MNVLTLAQAWWAQHTIHLDPEPTGERSGSVTIDGAEGRSLRFVAVGDSMIAGCGVDDQSEGFTPALAKCFSHTLNRSVDWEAHGRLGATMRRVRYRLMPEIEGQTDLMVVCAGSNDLMARRTLAEWKADLSATLDEAKTICDNIVVFSAAQLYRSPSLGAELRKVIGRMTEEQTAASKAICEEKHVEYLDMTHEDVHADLDSFYAHDRFHPGRYGYEYMAQRVDELLGEWLKSNLSRV